MIGRLADIILRDFWLKLFSLALAVLIWFTIFQAIQQQGSPVSAFNSKLVERTLFNLPVMPISSDSDVRGLKVSPKEVQVTVQGEAKSVHGLQGEEIKVRVDLSGVEPGNELRKRVEVSMPMGLTLVKIEPPEVQVIFPPKAATATN